MGVGREGQETRQQQNQEYADEQPDKAGHPHAEILTFPVVGAFRVGGEVPAGALEVGRLPLELLRGGAYKGLAAALEDRRIVLRALLENGRLLYAVHPLRNIVERLHELGELGLVVLRRLDLFELVESRFQPAPHHGHFRADLRALRLDRAP